MKKSNHFPFLLLRTELMTAPKPSLTNGAAQAETCHRPDLPANIAAMVRQELRFTLYLGLRFVMAAKCASSRSAAEKLHSQRDVLAGHQEKTKLGRAHLLFSLMPVQCFTLERDVFLHWVNIQSNVSLRSMAYLLTTAIYYGLPSGCR